MIRVESCSLGHYGYDTYSHCDVWESGPNSAGGVGVKITLRNYGYKTVRKCAVYLIPYNGAEEPVRCTVSNKCTKGVSWSDPISPNWEKTLSKENLWWNSSIRKYAIDSIEVTYDDGTTESCEGNYQPTEAEKQSYNKSKELTFKEFIILAIVIIAIIFIFHSCSNWISGGNKSHMSMSKLSEKQTTLYLSEENTMI